MASFFVDANTVISALLYAGNESQLLEYARQGLCELATNEHVREEVRRFLERQPGLSPSRRGKAMSRLARRIVVLPDPAGTDLAAARRQVPDPRDLAVVVGFQQSGCDFLVTGDRELRKAVPRALTTRQSLRRIEEELRAGDRPPDGG
jgi:predicted nucleic acid-binding protein